MKLYQALIFSLVVIIANAYLMGYIEPPLLANLAWSGSLGLALGVGLVVPAMNRKRRS